MDFFSSLVLALIVLVVVAFTLGKSNISTKTRRLASRFFLFGGLVALFIGLIIVLPDNGGFPTTTWWVGLYLVPIGALGVALWLGILIANVAAEKGRSWLAFFVLSFFLSPIIIGIVVATISPLPGSPRYVSPQPEPNGSAMNSSTPADQIEKLGTLLDKGLITQQEFEQKKKDLLDKL